MRFLFPFLPCWCYHHNVGSRPPLVFQRIHIYSLVLFQMMKHLQDPECNCKCPGFRIWQRREGVLQNKNERINEFSDGSKLQEEQIVNKLCLQTVTSSECYHCFTVHTANFVIPTCSWFWNNYYNSFIELWKGCCPWVYISVFATLSSFFFNVATSNNHYL